MSDLVEKRRAILGIPRRHRPLFPRASARGVIRCRSSQIEDGQGHMDRSTNYSGEELRKAYEQVMAGEEATPERVEMAWEAVAKYVNSTLSNISYIRGAQHDI